MVDREDDVLRRRRPFLRVADPLVRFHNVLVRPNVARIEQGQGLRVWREEQATVASHIFGPHFERLARWWTSRFAAEETLGGSPAVVGSTVVNDARGRTQHQVDVVVLSATDVILFLGEARVRRCGLAELRHLEAVRSLIGVRAAEARLGLFSATGFEATLRREADTRDDVELVDLVRMYEGQ